MSTGEWPTRTDIMWPMISLADDDHAQVRAIPAGPQSNASADGRRFSRPSARKLLLSSGEPSCHAPDMAKWSRNRRLGVLLMFLGLLLVVVGLGVYALWVPADGVAPPSGVPQEVDLVGIAALITSVGGFIGGLITAVTGLIVVLRKPARAQGEADATK